MSMSQGEDLLCEWCEEQETEPGQTICYECWKEEYTYDCCFCGEMENDEFMGRAIVVYEDEYGVLPGIYLVREWPYFMQPYIGSGYLYPHALQWAQSIPKGLEWHETPCGDLCLRCQVKYTMAWAD